MVYYKLFTARNRLILITPVFANCIAKINELEGTKLNYKDYINSGAERRFINNYRILKVKL